MLRIPAVRIPAAALLCLSALAAGGPGAWHTELESGLATARRSGRPVLVHLSASWCGPCRRMDRDVLHTKEVQELLDREVIGVALDFDANRDLAERWGVASVPADVFLTADGQVLGRISGYKATDDYVRRIAAVTDYHAREFAPRTRPTGPRVIPRAGRKLLGLKGHCPVALSRSREWSTGQAEFAAEHQGITYFMSSAENLKRFRSAPMRYAPRLLGCDPVVYFGEGRPVPGKVEFAAFFRQELFLFVSEQSREEFHKAPEEFAEQDDVVLLDELVGPARRH